MARVRRQESPRHLPVAILVDVDGTLAGPYRQGRRELRPSARDVLAMLSEAAPVFLWSIVGADNGTRLLQEFPELRPYVKGCAGKMDFPLDTVGRPYAIDDEAVDAPVLSCYCHLLDGSYWGGDELDDLRRVAAELVAEIRGEPA
ncbi:MAG TPA: hypothetical protein VF092_31240 [Longimicrobium sp.]